MFDQEILNNYAAANISCQIQASFSNGVTTNQKYLNLNQRHDLQNILDKYWKTFSGSLSVIQQVYSYQAQNWSTTVNIQYPSPMYKHSKRNSSTWLILEFSKISVPQSGPCLDVMLPKRWQGQTNVWSQFFQQMHKMKTILSDCYPW